MSIISDGIEAITRCVAAVKEITDGALTYPEQAALARVLNAYHEASGECSLVPAHQMAYEAAVDYLWMAYRISHEQKMSLLDLLG